MRIHMRAEHLSDWMACVRKKKKIEVMFCVDDERARARARITREVHVCEKKSGVSATFSSLC